MVVSLRSHLIAGTVAAVGAGAVALAPVAATGQYLPAVGVGSAAQIGLVAWSNPFEQLIATAEMAQNYLFATYYNGGDVPTPGAGEANWTAAGLDQTGGDVLNYLLYNEIALGYYSSVGLLPQGVINAGPVFQQLQINLFEYINIGLSGLNGALNAISSGVWNYPAALATAAELALQGQIPQAIAVLGDAIITPIVTATESLFSAGVEIATSFVTKLVAVVTSLPQIIATFAGTAAGGAVYLAQKTLSIATNWIGSLASFDLEGAWNVAVDGLLGPIGIPGAVLNLTTGAGVQTGPILNPETDIIGNFVPSVRTSYQAGLWTIAEALAVEPAPAAAVAVPAASASAARADAATTAPADDTESDVSSTASGDVADTAGEDGEDSAAASAPSPDDTAGTDPRAGAAQPGNAKAAAGQHRGKRSAHR